MCLTAWPDVYEQHDGFGSFIGGAKDNYLRIFDPRLNTQTPEGANMRWNVQNIRPQSYEPICGSYVFYFFEERIYLNVVETRITMSGFVFDRFVL